MNSMLIYSSNIKRLEYLCRNLFIYKIVILKNKIKGNITWFFWYDLKRISGKRKEDFSTKIESKNFSVSQQDLLQNRLKVNHLNEYLFFHPYDFWSQFSLVTNHEYL